MKSKLTALAGLILIAALLLTACAPAATPAPATEAPAGAPTQPPAAPTAAPEKVTLTIWYLAGSPEEAQLVQDHANKWAEAHPGVTIDFTPYDYTSMNEGIKLALDSHTGPDVAYVSPGYTSHLALAKAGHLVDLTDIMTQKGWDKTASVDMIKYYNITGPVWGIPYDLAAVGVFYNKDIFAKEGLKPPETFQDFETILAKLKADGITPLALGGVDQWPIQQNWEALFEGNTPFEKLTCLEASDKTCGWNIPTMVSSLEKLKEWVDKGYYNKDPLAVNAGDANASFIKGDIAMVVTGTWNNPPFSNEPKFHAGFFLMPRMDPTLPFHVGGYTPNNVWVVSKYSEHQDLAVDLITSMLGEDMAKTLWGIGDLVMYKFTTQPEPVFPLQAEEYTALQQALPGYYLGSNQDPKVQALLWPLLQEVVGGQSTPLEALDKVQEEYLKYAK
jgi:raffinose/stachyose/melibiose transport system substrate-binding protein